MSHGPHRHERLGEGPAKPGPRVVYVDALVSSMPATPLRAPEGHEARVAAAPVSCGLCHWVGTYSGLTKAGKCPNCRRQSGLVRL